MPTFTATALAMCRAGKEDSFLQIAMLGILAKTRRSEERTVRAVSDATGVPRPTISRNADQLVQRGLIENNPDPSDRRSVLLEITPDGTAYVRRMNNGWSEPT